jgi:phosphohistidine phosphatase SixA
MSQIKLILILVTSTLILILISGSIAIYSVRDKIPLVSKVLVAKGSIFGDGWVKGSDKDAYWAKEILKGGYILHFRHAEREKWIDIEAYDSLESEILQAGGGDVGKMARNEYFSAAVCLNSRGLIQARMMSEHLQRIKLPIGRVITSTSCRARETAMGGFGRVDQQEKLLVHNGPYWERYEDRVSALRDFYSNVEVAPSTNTVVIAHNSVILEEMLKSKPKDKLTLEEGGFFVIKRDENGKLEIAHRFYDFSSFIRVFYAR